MIRQFIVSRRFVASSETSGGWSGSGSVLDRLTSALPLTHLLLIPLSPLQYSPSVHTTASFPFQGALVPYHWLAPAAFSFSHYLSCFTLLPIVLGSSPRSHTAALSDLKTRPSPSRPFFSQTPSPPSPPTPSRFLSFCQSSSRSTHTLGLIVSVCFGFRHFFGRSTNLLGALRSVNIGQFRENLKETNHLWDLLPTRSFDVLVVQRC